MPVKIKCWRCWAINFVNDTTKEINFECEQCHAEINWCESSTAPVIDYMSPEFCNCQNCGKRTDKFMTTPHTSDDWIVRICADFDKDGQWQGACRFNCTLCNQENIVDMSYIGGPKTHFRCAACRGESEITYMIWDGPINQLIPNPDYQGWHGHTTEYVDHMLAWDTPLPEPTHTLIVENTRLPD